MSNELLNRFLAGDPTLSIDELSSLTDDGCEDFTLDANAAREGAKKIKDSPNRFSVSYQKQFTKVFNRLISGIYGRIDTNSFDWDQLITTIDARHSTLMITSTFMHNGEQVKIAVVPDQIKTRFSEVIADYEQAHQNLKVLQFVLKPDLSFVSTGLA